jgi:CHAD domain-containing protein
MDADPQTARQTLMKPMPQVVSMTAAGRDAPAKPAAKRRRGWCSEPAGEAAVRLAHRYLDAAAESAGRMMVGNDPEALHDFRVALRRLRSVLRTFRSCLGKLPKKLRRLLKRVVRATGTGRDAEVFLGWLDAQSSLPAAEHAASEWLHNQLVTMRDEAYENLRAQVLTDFADLAQQLRRELTARRSQASYGEVMAEHVHDQSAKLAADLARIRSAADTEFVHDARIQGKRLRYLIEPVSPRLPGARTAVKRLKAFQDETGALCDGFVRRRLLARQAEMAGAEQTRAAIESVRAEQMKIPMLNDVVPGLLRLAQRSERQVDREFQRFRRRYLDERTRRLIEPFSRLGHRLAGTR